MIGRDSSVFSTISVCKLAVQKQEEIDHETDMDLLHFVSITAFI